MFALADRLHKTIGEIEQISLSEYNEWMAYLNLLSKEENV
jgi:hypothetical protein